MARRRLVWLLVALITPLLLIAELHAQTENLTDGLIGCWDLSEDAGTRYDDWFNEFHLTDNNTVGNDTGHINAVSAEFDRTNNEYLDRADNVAYSGLAQLEMIVWAKFNTIATLQLLVGRDDGVTANREFYLGFLHTTNRLRFSGRETGGSANIVYANTFGPVTTTAWIMIDAYSNGTNLGIAVNNGTFDIASFEYALHDSAVDLRVGSRGDDAYDYDGQMEVFAMWNRPLTGEERAYIYNSGDGRNCASITALPGGGTFSAEQILLPSGNIGSLEYTVSAGQAAIAVILLIILSLVLFEIISQRVRQTRASDT
jgi:hypothetical protein